jgi:hypothetical protein
MQFSKIEQIAVGIAVVLLLPTAANAACTRGPDVVVNRGHGASITFDEPVYQAQVFDVSKLMLEPIPEQGTQALILTAVEAQQFPGLPQTATTSLLANTASGCYVFNISFGIQAVHNTVSATAETDSELVESALLPGGEDIDIEALRAEYATAVEQHGEDNQFLQRVAEFLALVDIGTRQRLAAQQAGVEWEHLTKLSGQSQFDRFVEDSLST